MNSNNGLQASLFIDQDGWCAQADQIPSPNFDERPHGSEISLLIIHNISLPPGRFGGSFIVDLFLNQLDCTAHPFFEQLKSLRVSAHFLVHRDGALVQFVSSNDRAWHAGLSSFGGRPQCNDFSIGIEMEGTDFEPFTPLQYKTLCLLTEALRQRYPITHVRGHQHIAPERKTDPGPFFDWHYYKQLMSLKESGSDKKMLTFP